MDKQREMFEAWYGDNYSPYALKSWNGDDKYYSNLDTELAWQAWQAAIAAQWQPIETAPKDGTAILAYTAEGQCEVSWLHGEWLQSPCYSTYDGCGAAVLLCPPTHWMPLPPEPTK